MRLSTREPVSRPLDVVALEVVLTLSQAALVGILLWLGQGFWRERGVQSGPVLAVLIVLALAAGAGWLAWLVNADGRLMAATAVPIALLLAFVWLLLGQGTITGKLDGWVILVGVGAALLGIGCGIILPSPRERRPSSVPRARPRSGRVPLTPRVSPTLSRAVAGLPRIKVPAAVSRGVASAGASVRSVSARRGRDAGEPSGLAVAPDVPATRGPDVDVTGEQASGVVEVAGAAQASTVQDQEDWDDPALGGDGDANGPARPSQRGTGRL